MGSTFAAARWLSNTEDNVSLEEGYHVPAKSAFLATSAETFAVNNKTNINIKIFLIIFLKEEH